MFLLQSSKPTFALRLLGHLLLHFVMNSVFFFLNKRSVYNQFMQHSYSLCNIVCFDCFPARCGAKHLLKDQIKHQHVIPQGWFSPPPEECLRCAACLLQVTYCSVACQRLHWFSHKKMCSALQAPKDAPRIKELKGSAVRWVVSVDTSLHMNQWKIRWYSSDHRSTVLKIYNILNYI